MPGPPFWRLAAPAWRSAPGPPRWCGGSCRGLPCCGSVCAGSALFWPSPGASLSEVSACRGLGRGGSSGGPLPPPAQSVRACGLSWGLAPHSSPPCPVGLLSRASGLSRYAALGRFAAFVPRRRRLPSGRAPAGRALLNGRPLAPIPAGPRRPAFRPRLRRGRAGPHGLPFGSGLLAPPAPGCGAPLQPQSPSAPGLPPSGPVPAGGGSPRRAPCPSLRAGLRAAGLAASQARPLSGLVHSAGAAGGPTAPPWAAMPPRRFFPPHLLLDTLNPRCYAGHKCTGIANGAGTTVGSYPALLHKI